MRGLSGGLDWVAEQFEAQWPFFHNVCRERRLYHRRKKKLVGILGRANILAM